MRAIQGLRIPNKETISRTNMRGGNHLPKSWSMLCGQGISEKKPQGMHFVTPPLVRAISSFNLPIPRWPYATPTDSPFKGKRKPQVPTHAWHFRAKKSFFPLRQLWQPDLRHFIGRHRHSAIQYAKKIAPRKTIQADRSSRREPGNW